MSATYLFEELPGRFVRLPVHVGSGPVERPSIVAVGSTIVMPDAAALQRHMAERSYGSTDASPASLFVLELPPRKHQGQWLVDHMHLVALTVDGATPEQAKGDAVVLRRIPWGRSKVHAGRDTASDRARLSQAHQTRLATLERRGKRVVVTSHAFERGPSGLEVVSAAPVTSLVPRHAAACATPAELPPLPSAEELAREVATNPVLGAIVARATLHRQLGYGGSDIIIAGLDSELDSSELYSEDAQKRLVPFLQRLGFGVLRWSPVTDSVVSLSFPGNAHRKRQQLIHNQARELGETREGELCDYYYPRSFAQVRMRGLIKCLPRLLGMLRAARIRLVDPAADARAACAAADVEASELDRLGRTEAEVRALEQDSRKRKLVDALHADEEDTNAGVRWAGVVTKRAWSNDKHPGPLRLAAVRDGIYCFQPYYLGMDDVVLLKHDEFDVAWQKHGADANCFWRGGILEAEFQWRREADPVDSDQEPGSEDED